MPKKFIAYTRVSTSRQGTQSVSLQEQHRAIKSYAIKHGLRIKAWYEEQCSATKRGRPVFDQVMDKLRSGEVGLILHKVDRGARNLRDWASIGEAIDLGVDVRFAHDDIDMTTRGGRLAADIQAVIAADYIRNLKEEVRKGIQGRLHQGLYPLRAPRGYLDCGGGKAKRPDPAIAPLIIAVFERYATGSYTYQQLATELAVVGLATKAGGVLSPDAISRILSNPFYAGTIQVKGRSYPGIHQPLITTELFDRVRFIKRNRATPKLRKHRFQYQGRLVCRECQRLLTGERQKSRIYYRCHRCAGVSVREDRILRSESSSFRLVERQTSLLPYAKFESHNVSGIYPKPCV